MGTTDNIILNLPFDEGEGSNIAYDYSSTRSDMEIPSGAQFVRARNGNALKLSGEALEEVSKRIFSKVTPPFTICMYARIPCNLDAPTSFIWLLNFKNLSNNFGVSVSIDEDVWRHFALICSGETYSFYLDGELIEEITQSGEILGASLNLDYGLGVDRSSLIDDVKIYNIALTPEALKEVVHPSKKSLYTINGIDFTDFGVYVSDSDGILNRPKLKPLASVSWDNYHGEDVDLNHKYYEAREITLSCFIKAKDKLDFISKISAFEQIFDAKGLQRLVIDVHPTKPLIYEVYCKDEIAVAKKWSDHLMVGTFKLKLTEPQPVKRVLKHIRISEETKTCTINITTPKYVTIYWGDGTVEEDVQGQNISLSHDYTKNGEYFPVITGCIDEIHEFRTNAIVVWNKL